MFMMMKWSYSNWSLLKFLNQVQSGDCRMDKCADQEKNCYTQVASGCSSNYIPVLTAHDDQQWKCCLTDDAGVAEVLNAAVNRTETTSCPASKSDIDTHQSSRHQTNLTRKYFRGHSMFWPKTLHPHPIFRTPSPEQIRLSQSSDPLSSCCSPWSTSAPRPRRSETARHTKLFISIFVKL